MLAVSGSRADKTPANLRLITENQTNIRNH